MTDRNFWVSFWESKKDLIFELPADYVFGRMLAQIVKEKNIKSAVELGGFPGYYATYLKKYQQIEATLFDYFVHYDLVNRLLKKNGLKEGDIQIIESDLFTYHPEKQYDLVLSFGLIEHFTDLKDIIQNHLKFLNPGGTLFITLPNFRGVNGWVQKKFDHENYLKHNISSMDLELLETISKQLGLKVKRVAYHGRFTVWLENKAQKSAATKAIVKSIWLSGKVITKIFGFESKALSPYIILEAEKPVN